MLKNSENQTIFQIPEKWSLDLIYWFIECYESNHCWKQQVFHQKKDRNMDKKKIIALKDSFDSIVQSVEKEHVEYWYARDIMFLLGDLK